MESETRVLCDPDDEEEEVMETDKVNQVVSDSEDEKKKIVPNDLQGDESQPVGDRFLELLNRYVTSMETNTKVVETSNKINICLYRALSKSDITGTKTGTKTGTNNGTTVNAPFHLDSSSGLNFNSALNFPGMSLNLLILLSSIYL